MQSIRKGLKLMPIMKKNSIQIEQKIQKQRKRKQSFQSVHLIAQNIQCQQSQDCDQSPIDIKNNFQEKYQILQKIGQGSNGVVKKCYNKSKCKYFAVKIIQMNDQHIQMIKQTFLLIKKLNHKNIIKYKALYFNDKKKKCYLVMQLIQMNSLQKHIISSQDQLKSIIYSILDALAYLHKNSICHRDIKPENILYDPEKRDVKLIDFGICKSLLKRGRYEEMLTNTGTLYYKAPQMFKGCGYTQKIDIWALGITMYKLITSKTPFQSVYLSDTISNIQTKQLQFKDKSFTKYSSMVINLLTRLLKRKKDQRFSAQQGKKHFWFQNQINREDLLTRSDSTKFWQNNLNNNDNDNCWQIQYEDKQENNSPYNQKVKNMKRKKSFDEKVQEPDTSSSVNDNNNKKQSKKQLKKKLSFQIDDQYKFEQLCSSDSDVEDIVIQLKEEDF